MTLKTDQMVPIAFEGRLTDGERETLHSMRHTELFRIARKLCASEYAIVCEQLTSPIGPNDLLVAQGQLRGIKAIYNLLMSNAASEGKSPEALQNPKKLRNIKE